MAGQYPWYEVVEGQDLMQGDLVERCPVLVPEEPPAVGGDEELSGIVREYDVVILSQSCDLEQGKLDVVLVCPHWSLEKFGEVEGYFQSKKGREEIRRGNIPGYHMLGATDQSGAPRGIRIVDFRAAASLPVSYLSAVAARQGPRLRLLPPYREHLAQAFARFFMRVGLPVDIPRFT